MEDSGDKCSICNKTYLPDKSSTWVDSEGREVRVPEWTIVLALVESEGIEYTVCEACYPEKALAVIPTTLIHDLHYQFGLEYQARGDWTDKSKSCFLRALAIKRSAEALTGLAQTIQDKTQSLSLLKEAVEIAPDDSFAKSVLEDFQERDGLAVEDPPSLTE